MQRRSCRLVEGAIAMTPASDTALESLHATATGIFTGALKACNIASAFDRRMRFEGNILHRLLPDGSGPATIDLSAYKRVFVIALGKAAGTHARDPAGTHEARARDCAASAASNQLPTKRNWRFRYFESGHPLPNEDSFAAARAALALLRKARKDTIVFFLISGGGSAMFDLPLDPHITLEDTIDVQPVAAGLGRADQRGQYAAQAFLRGQGRPPGDGRAGGDQGEPAAARRAAAHARRALFGTDLARSLHRGRCARAPRQIRSCGKASGLDPRVF